MSEEAPLPKPEDYVGRTLDGRYRLDAVLGQGGMGMVFRATQTSMDRPVAVKTLHPQLAMAATFFERFKREAELASRLHHPNIITIYDFGRAPDSICYFVMELLEGESLRQLVKREGPMTLRRAAAVLEQATLGVAHAHKQGVVHRDIKPHNIMLSRGGPARVRQGARLRPGQGAGGRGGGARSPPPGRCSARPSTCPPSRPAARASTSAAISTRSPASSTTTLTGALALRREHGAQGAPGRAHPARPPIVGSARVGAPVPPAIDALHREGAVGREEGPLPERRGDAGRRCTPPSTRLSDAVLDAVPSGGAGGAAGKESGSGSNSGAKKGSKASSAASSRKLAAPGPLPQLAGTVSVAFDKRVTSPEMPSVVEPAPAGALWVKLLLVAVPVMLLAASGTLFVLKQREKAQPALPVVVTPPHAVPVAPPPAAPQLLSVTLQSTPPGASVLEDGVLVGTTPLQRQWPKEATRRVTFQLQGYQDLERSFRPEKDEAFDVQLVAVKHQSPTPPDKPKKKPGTGDGIEAFE